MSILEIVAIVYCSILAMPLVLSALIVAVTLIACCIVDIVSPIVDTIKGISKKLSFNKQKKVK